MDYTNIIDTMKWRYSHTKKLKYFSYENFDEYNNEFSKGWSLGSEIITGTNIYTLTTLKIDISDQPFIKYDIFEATVNLPPRGTHIGIIAQYCEHHSMSYIYHSKNNISCNHDFPARNRTNVWILRIGRK